jgi:arylsulfatase A-like enzyme
VAAGGAARRYFIERLHTVGDIVPSPAPPRHCLLPVLAIGALLGGACVDGDGKDGPDPQPGVQITPEVAYATVHDLRCLAPEASAVRWLRDGLPFDGTTTTEQLDGDVVPGASLLPGARFTCEALDAAGAVSGEASRTISRPSVVLIVADDLGYGDLGTFGHPTVPTPALDRLASEGVRLTRAYASAAACSPSRAGLLTGRQQNRFGFEYNMGVEDAPSALNRRGLPAEERTIADLLGEVGLATAAIGKWHVGVADDQHPNARGFDHFFGFLDGRRLSLAPGLPGVAEFDVQAFESGTWPVSATGGQLERNGVIEAPDARHLNDHLIDEAIAWMEETAPEPFFLYLALHAPHLPLQAGPDYLALLPDPPTDPGQLAYQANVAGLDQGIGRVLDTLDALDLGEHTLVVFTSDNGCVDVGGFCTNAPYRGGKLTLAEGGVRVPAVIRWPGRLPAGVDVDDPVSNIDLLPTFAAATGAALPPVPIDGTDLVPLLRAGAMPARELFWRVLPVRAIHADGYKLVHAFDVATSTEWRWLFDTELDPTEQANLAEAEPDKVDELLERLDERARAAYAFPAWEPRTGVAEYYGEIIPVAF